MPYDRRHTRPARMLSFCRPMAKIPLDPAHPERICWGCEQYCPADDLRCGNGTIRTMHPCELFGADWLDWSTGRRHDGPAAPALRGDAS